MQQKKNGDFSVASGASISNALDDLSSRVKSMMDMLPKKPNREDSDDQRWAKRIARRLRREAVLKKNRERNYHSPDQLMKTLCRAEKISQAVHNDLLKLGSSVNANTERLRRIRNSQFLLNRDVRQIIDRDSNNNSFRTRDNYSHIATSTCFNQLEFVMIVNQKPPRIPSVLTAELVEIRMTRKPSYLSSATVCA